MCADSEGGSGRGWRMVEGQPCKAHRCVQCKADVRQMQCVAGDSWLSPASVLSGLRKSWLCEIICRQAPFFCATAEAFHADFSEAVHEKPGEAGCVSKSAKRAGCGSASATHSPAAGRRGCFICRGLVCRRGVRHSRRRGGCHGRGPGAGCAPGAGGLGLGWGGGRTRAEDRRSAGAGGASQAERADVRVPQVEVGLCQLAGVAVDAPLEVEAMTAPFEAAKAPDDTIWGAVQRRQHAPVSADDGHVGGRV